MVEFNPRKIGFNPEENVKEKVTYYKNEDGTNGSIFEVEKSYDYDKDGKEDEFVTIRYDRDRKEIFRDTFFTEYDERGNTTKISYYRNNRDIPDLVRENSFDENNNLASSKLTVNGTKSSFVEYDYDGDGKVDKVEDLDRK